MTYIHSVKDLLRSCRALEIIFTLTASLAPRLEESAVDRASAKLGMSTDEVSAGSRVQE